MKIAVNGGVPQALANVLSARGGSWGSKNVILYAPDTGSGIYRINADGAGAAPVTLKLLLADTQEQTHRWPLFLPDGDHFLFWAGNFSNLADDRDSGIYLSSLDGKDKRLVVLCHSGFAYDSGRLYYADDQRQLVSIAFDANKGKVSGSAVALAPIVGFQPSTFWTAVTSSFNGTLIYNTGVGAAQSQLVWMDRAGKELGRIGEPAVMANPTLSPDGSRVAVDIADLKANNVDIWLLSTSGAGDTRFNILSLGRSCRRLVARWKRHCLSLRGRGWRRHQGQKIQWPGARHGNHETRRCRGLHTEFVVAG